VRVTWTGRVELWSSAHEAARLTRRSPGVVEVADKLSFDVDDRAPTIGAGIAFGASLEQRPGAVAPVRPAASWSERGEKGGREVDPIVRR
jgi:hypothetical protein